MDDGCAVERGRLSLCLINNYHGSFRKTALYQVHCDDSKVKHSQLYPNMDEAIDKFLELKRKIR